MTTDTLTTEPVAAPVGVTTITNPALVEQPSTLPAAQTAPGAVPAAATPASASGEAVGQGVEVNYARPFNLTSDDGVTHRIEAGVQRVAAWVRGHWFAKLHETPTGSDGRVIDVPQSDATGVTALIQRTNAAESVVADLRAEVDRLNGLWTMSEARCRSLDNQVANLQTGLAERGVAAPTGEAAAPPDDVKKLQGDLANAQAQLETRTAELTAAQAQLAAKAAAPDVQLQLDAATADVTAKQQRIADLEAQLAQAQADLDAATAPDGGDDEVVGDFKVVKSGRNNYQIKKGDEVVETGFNTRQQADGRLKELSASTQG